MEVVLVLVRASPLSYSGAANWPYASFGRVKASSHEEVFGNQSANRVWRCSQPAALSTVLC